MQHKPYPTAVYPFSIFEHSTCVLTFDFTQKHEEKKTQNIHSCTYFSGKRMQAKGIVGLLSGVKIIKYSDSYKDLNS